MVSITAFQKQLSFNHSFLLKIYILCVWVYHVYAWALHKSEVGNETPRTGITDGCEPQYGFWNLPQEQQIPPSQLSNSSFCHFSVHVCSHMFGAFRTTLFLLVLGTQTLVQHTLLKSREDTDNNTQPAHSPELQRGNRNQGTKHSPNKDKTRYQHLDL